MLAFYADVLIKKWPDGVRQLLTKWRFWLWWIPIVAAYLIPGRYWQPIATRIENFPNWLLAWLLLGAAFYVFLQVVYEEVDEPGRELKELKTKLAEATSTEQLKKLKLVERLRQLLTSGIGLRKEIMRTYMPDKHKPRKTAWQEEILEVLRSDAPNYESEMLLAPDGRVPMPKGTERDFAARDMDEWLSKLNLVIKAIDGK